MLKTHIEITISCDSKDFLQGNDTANVVSHHGVVLQKCNPILVWGELICLATDWEGSC